MISFEIESNAGIPFINEQKVLSETASMYEISNKSRPQI